ncbi:MAG: ergothioneine biosynthesis protein EgtB [SAR202 cluster bacterium]|nr:ergothioneine biosynthesis protein EgtB [SAR202 cluster bacterium]
MVSTGAIEEACVATTRDPARETRDPARLATWFREVRQATEAICKPLATEDYVVQAMPDVSPAKWHLAHITWFFETFVLKPHARGHDPFNPQYEYLFNSYYNQVGPQYYRPHRGLLSRPTVAEVYDYRRSVDDAVRLLLERADERLFERVEPIVVLGLHHEQQHQELLFTDLKYNFGINPLRPVCQQREIPIGKAAPPMSWHAYQGGIVDIGWDGNGFAFDNESPRHRALLRPFKLGSRLVTNGEFMEFMRDGGYSTPQLWLSEGWATVRVEHWEAPLYWERHDGEWWSFTLAGMRPVDPHGPVTHVSHFEADAFARWAGKRLPTEFEWEHAASREPLRGNFAESGVHHPVPATGDGHGLEQLFGDVWEWTASAYLGYPGFRAPEGAIGEYNGKFMMNQMVLRGGSCATPESHIRVTYRNFFPPHARWQFMGIRLADDA